jgi:adenine-specific DNA-methyltransferase
MAKKDYSKLEKDDLLKVIEKLESRKKYGLIWDEEKTKEQFEKESENALPVLKEVKGKEIRTDTKKPTNILIEGDNYHALSVLNYTHQGKVDVIYIDPPYNTGNKDFKYNDDYVDKEDAYRHSKWLSFMGKRLRLAKNLLKDDGVIFISIGEDEIAQLKLLCNEIFGEQNYITNFIWEKTQHFGRQKVNFYSNADYILCYAKQLNNSGLKELLVESIKEEHEDAPLYNASNPLNTLTIPAKKVIFNIPDGEYSRTTDDKYKLVKKVIVKNGKNKNELVLRFKSRWSQRKVEEELQKGTTFWVKSENFAIRAIYGSGKTSNESPKQIIFTNGNNEFFARSRFGQKVGVNEEASNELFNMIGEQNIFDYPKPRTLIEYLVSLIFDRYENSYQKDITILDFFAGSGTTGHAVLNLNKKDEGSRNFILCTNNEENICSDICYPRIQKAIKGYKIPKGDKIEGLGGNLKYFKTAFVKNSISRDDLKMRITRECTEMLCLREGIFDEINSGVGYKIFSQNGKAMAVYYALERDGMSSLKKDLDKMKGEKILYCFTLDPLGLDKEDFVDWQGVNLEPIPQKILDIYEQIYEY